MTIQLVHKLRRYFPPKYFLGGKMPSKGDFVSNGQPLAHRRTWSGFQDSSRYWWIGVEHAGLTNDKHCLERRKTDTSTNAPAWSSMWIVGVMLHEKIDKPKLEPRERILKKNNDAIAKWLDRRHSDHAKMMKALKRNTGQTTMLWFLIPEELDENTTKPSKHVYKRRDKPAFLQAQILLMGINHQSNPWTNLSTHCITYPLLYPSF